MTSVINAAHAHHTRVVLTVSVFAWTSGEAAKQRALLGSASAAAQPRPPGGRRRARPRRGRREPRLRADRGRPLRRLHGVRADPAQGARPHPPRLSAHVRHDRLDRQLPDRGRDAAGRRRRDLHHGLRLPRLRGDDRRGRSTRSPARATPSTTRSGPTPRGCHRPSSSSACRTTGGPGRRRRAACMPGTRAGRSSGRRTRSRTRPLRP